MISGNFVSEVDAAFLYVMYISVALMIGVTATLIYFVWRYHHTRSPKGTDIHNNVPLEIAWTVGPTLLVLSMFWFGFKGYQHMSDVPDDAMQVTVTGRMWNWVFTYPNGLAVSDSLLRIPADQAIYCKMEAVDVLHSFYIPELRIKKDCVPNGNNFFWFSQGLPEGATSDTMQVFCTEYCGQRHSYMYAKLLIMEPAAFNQWYADASAKMEADAAAATTAMPTPVPPQTATQTATH